MSKHYVLWATAGAPDEARVGDAVQGPASSQDRLVTKGCLVSFQKKSILPSLSLSLSFLPSYPLTTGIVGSGALMLGFLVCRIVLFQHV